MAKFLSGYAFTVKATLGPDGDTRVVRVRASYTLADTEDERLSTKRDLDLVLSTDPRSADVGEKGLDIEPPDAAIERGIVSAIERSIRRASKGMESLPILDDEKEPVARG